jgi:hypothetical protein
MLPRRTSTFLAERGNLCCTLALLVVALQPPPGTPDFFFLMRRLLPLTLVLILRMFNRVGDGNDATESSDSAAAAGEYAQ